MSGRRLARRIDEEALRVAEAVMAGRTSPDDKDWLLGVVRGLRVAASIARGSDASVLTERDPS